MIAFHGKIEEKRAILRQLRAHAKADEIVKGQYWEDGKGCAVGCTIHSEDHAEYEPLFGIPQMLAHLEDRIFEGLPNCEAKAWPMAFMSAIRPGADLSRVGWQFLHWLLTDKSINPGIDHPIVREAVRQCADVMLDMTRDKRGAEAAAEAARAAAEAAWSARAAAEAAWSARAAAEAARSASWAGRSARSARSASWVKMSEKLLELLRAA